MDQDLLIHFPSFEGSERSLGHESITLDATLPRIEASYYDLAGEVKIAEPDLVFGKKPERVVRFIEMLEARAQAWGL